MPEQPVPIKPAMAPAGSKPSPLQPLKALYMKAEGKYYDVLEKINKSVPVLKVTDAIDKIVPSFAVLIALVVILLISGMVMLIPSGAQPTVTVFDANQMPLEGVIAGFVVQDDDLQLESDEAGILLFPVVGETLVSFSKAGFVTLDRELNLQSGATYTIFLEEEVTEVTKTLSIQDQEGNPIDGKEITASFNCKSGNDTPADLTNYTGTLFVTVSESCDVVSATVSVNGFQTITKQLLTQKTIFAMQPLLQVNNKKARLNVSVEDDAGNPLEGITLNVYRERSGDFVFDSSAFTTSAGNYSFELLLGTYKVVAVDDEGNFESQESDPRTLSTEDETKDVFLELAFIPESERSKIYLKTIDTDSEDTLQSTALIFANNDLIARVSSLSNGTIEYPVDSNFTYSVVLNADNHVIKILENVSLVGRNASSPTEIALDAFEYNENNVGLNFVSIDVHVNDEEDVVVDDAKIFMFNELLNGLLIAGPLQVNDDGVASFTGLPLLDTDYYAIAENAQATGKSESWPASIGTPYLMNVTLVLGKATIKVKTVNANTGSVVGSAHVQLLDAINDNNVLIDSLTGSNGLTPPIEVSIATLPYAIIDANTFMSFTSRAFPLQTDESFTLLASLIPETNTPANLEARFMRVLEENRSPASLLQSGNNYYVQFQVVAPATATEHAFHASVETPETTLADGSLLLKKGFAPMNTAGIHSSTVNASNRFSDPSIVDGDAKQVNFYLGELTPGVYQFETLIEVKETATPGTRVSMQYQAKNSNGETTLQTIAFTIGEPLFCDASSASCPDYVYSFNLHSQEDDAYIQSAPILANTFPELIQGVAYTVDYFLWNQTSEALQNAIVSIHAVQDVFGFTVLEQTLGFVNRASSVANSVTFTPTGTANPAQLLFSLNATAQDANATIGFTIVSQKELRIAFIPEVLLADRNNAVLVYVRDDESNPLRNALVTVAENAGFTQGNQVFRTNAEGFFLYSVTAPAEGKAFYFKAIKPGFQETTAVLDTVRQRLSFSAGERFACVDISPEEIQLQPTGSRSMFFVNNCRENIELNLVQHNIAALSVSSTRFTLTPSESKEVTVSNALYPGMYELIIQGKYPREQALTSFRVLPITVLSTSCFSLDSASFNLFNQNDTGLVTNACHNFLESFQYPAVELDLDDVLAVHLQGEATDTKNIQLNIERDGQVTREDVFYRKVNSKFEMIKDQVFETSILENNEFLHVNYIDVALSDGKTGKFATHNIFIKQPDQAEYTSITKGMHALNLGGSNFSLNGDAEGFVDSTRRNELQGIATVCNGISSCAGVTIDGVPANQFNKYQGVNRFSPYFVNAPTNKIKLRIGGAPNVETDVYSISVNYAADADHQGVIDFNVFNKGFAGEQFALLTVEDYIDDGSGTPVLATERFHVKIAGAQENMCFGPNDIPGLTGEEGKPKIKLDWSWLTIEQNQCDTSHASVTFCDSTQFGITLLKKMLAVQDLITANQYANRYPLLNFQSFLVQDGYSEDWRNDFSEYLKSQLFLEVPLSYINTEDGLHRIFEDPSRFIIVSSNPEESVIPINGPGLYDVSIALTFDDEETIAFFNEGEPNVTITVYLTKLRPPERDSVLYRIPFDGAVGLNPLTNNLDRIGYGREFTGDSILVASKGSERFSTLITENPAQGALNITNVTDFNSMNGTGRGMVLIIQNNELYTQFSEATPILMTVEKKNNTASQAYLIQNDGILVPMDKSLLLWNTAASTMGTLACNGFSGESVPLHLPDSILTAKQNKNACAVNNSVFSPTDQDNALTVTFKDISNASEGDVLLMQSVIYTPLQEDYSFVPVCDDLSSQHQGLNAFTDARGQFINQNVRSGIPLNYSRQKLAGNPINSLKNIIDGVEQEYLCVTSFGSQFTYIYWNEDKLFDDLSNHYPEVAGLDYSCIQ